MMKTLAALLALSTASTALADNYVTYEPKEGPGKGKHIVLLAGDEEYRSEEAMPMLGKLLSQRHGFKCTVLFDIDPDGNILFVTSKNFGMGKTHPVAWYKATGKGRTFYTSMGHTGQTFQEPEFVQLLENVVNWQVK